MNWSIVLTLGIAWLAVLYYQDPLVVSRTAELINVHPSQLRWTAERFGDSVPGVAALYYYWTSFTISICNCVGRFLYFYVDLVFGMLRVITPQRQ